MTARQPGSIRARRSPAVSAALVAVVLLGLLAARPAGAANEAADYLSRINALRASVGVQPLQADGELTAAAQGWAADMAATGVLAHSPDLGSGITQRWVKLGENIGVGPDVGSIFSAFVGSVAHYRNLVDPAFNRVGVGVAFGGGHQWTCHRFMQVSGGGVPTPAPAPAPPRPPAPAPRPSPTTTAAPPTPAVTTPVPPPAPPTGPPPPADAARVASVLTALRELSAGT